MTDTTGLCIDSCIDALPGWQRGFCREVLQLVRAAGSQVTETIMRIDRPWFVLEGAFLYDGASSRPRGNHHRGPGRQDRPRRGHPVRRSSHRARADRLVAAGHRQRRGGRLARAQRHADGPGLDAGLSGIPGR